MSSKKNKKTKKSKVINKIFDGEPIANSNTIGSEFDFDVDISVVDTGLEKNKKSFVIFGAILTFFAIIGFITSIMFGYRSIKNFTTGASSKKDLMNVIYPLVMIDATEFSDISELSSDQIIASSIWSIIMSPEELDKYNATMDVINVPTADLEKYAAKIFGSNFPKLEYANVGTGDFSLYYIANTDSYNVPVNPGIFSYVPEINSVNIDGDIYTLKVDYVIETPEWRNLNDGFEKQVAKTVEFKIQKNDDSYIIKALKVLNVNSIN